MADDAGWASERTGDHPKPQVHSWLLTFTLAYNALGVVYGDIGTSPLYTFSSIFTDVDALEKEDALMGLSLIFWTITMVVLVKYVCVVLHANDHGEGSTFALYSNLCQVLGIGSFGALKPQEHSQLKNLSKHLTLNRLSQMSAMSRESAEALERARLALRGATSPGVPIHDASVALLPTDRAATAPGAALTVGPLLPAASAPVVMVERGDSNRHVALGVHEERESEGSEYGGAALADVAPRGRERWWRWAAFPAQPIINWFRASPAAQTVLLATTIIAPAMEFGDGVLTPAISVVSAVSGLQVGASGVTQDTVMGVSIAILVLLFSVQFRGTASVSFLFAPVVLIWLAANCAIGFYNLGKNGGEALKGLSPHYIGLFFAKYGAKGWAMLGAVMLSVTGAEAMFSDLGHFSIGAIVVSWVGFAYPCLIFTYLGQTSHLLEHLDDLGTLYWSTVPKPVFWPMLVLATLATVVASQALISACFQICKQARALNFFPRVKIAHTSKEQHGQIYVPAVNWSLMVLCIVVVVGFKADSVHLGNAYGLTISMVMFITTLLVTLIMVTKWRLSALLVVPFFLVFFVIDGAFVSANMNKVPKGGWVALALAAGVSCINLIWWAGQRKRARATQKREQLRVTDWFTVLLPKADPGSMSRLSTASAPTPDMLQLTASRLAAAGGMHGQDQDDFKGEVEEEDGEVIPVVAPGDNPLADADAELRLQLLRGELQLALVVAPHKPLVTLPGVGLYYHPNTDTVPAVLRYFMRAVEAVHQVNIFLCVRHLPIPAVSDRDRLVVRVVPELPNTYQAVARYGYMDRVDHGPAFVDALVVALVNTVEARVHELGAEIAEQHSRALPPATSSALAATRSERLPSPGAGVAPPNSEAEPTFLHTVRQMSMPPQQQLPGDAGEPQVPSKGGRQAAPSLTAALPSSEVQMADVTLATLSRAALERDSRRQSVSFARGKALTPSAQLKGGLQAERTQVDMGRLSRAIARTSLARYSQANPAMAATFLDGVGRPAAVPGEDPLISALNMALEEAGLRTAHLQAAAAAGVTYYMGRTNLRMKPGTSWAHHLVYENLYKPMLLLSYAETEAWNVPVADLVELGMVLHI